MATVYYSTTPTEPKETPDTEDEPPTMTVEQLAKSSPTPTQNLPSYPGGQNPITGEVGGPKGAEPTRFGDWERGGRAVDF
ncbi:hypothetical protein H696_04929 [Fonticula alba]|uniref:Succinate dehydrogenase assembly factor 4, mitochondrial n=1 Tax=Fonticula alba TaxID=691883 RepID=A0A058Z3Y5_FONAL|nr:hypothetical protein H696_04929 [Fonticula alba]KCV68638.1 hypothetical protein H696_04929 [Fonticula alba]|eukprot:XP_009497070.1 hypothetical protein H696_04929 [Fonticula alba]